MTHNLIEKRLCKLFQLLLAHARNATELYRCRRVMLCHFAERYIREDDVSGRAAFICELATQARKQYFVAFDRARLDSWAFLRDFDLLGQNDLFPLSQCLQTGGRYERSVKVRIEHEFRGKLEKITTTKTKTGS